MTFSLSDELQKQGIALDKTAEERFEIYYRMLVEWNEKMNLTAITDYNGVMEKHFYDSLTPAFFHDFTSVPSLIDIGSGAGFPAIPLKILYPHLQITIVDSLMKRITFLTELTKALQLDGITLVHGRAEEVARKDEFRDAFPFAVARAVARLPVLLELCLPFVRADGTFLALKGSSGQEELNESANALKKLGSKWVRSEHFTLPHDGGQRMLLWFKKEKPTPKAYPRKPGVPAKNPIL